MLKELGLFNFFGNGDIVESREFVRATMKLFPAERYVYYTNKSTKLLSDIEGLESSPDFLAVMDHTTEFIKTEDSLYINTWIGRNPKYVLGGYACTLEKLYEMYNDILGKINGSKLPGTPVDYLTSFNYLKYDIENINSFMNTIQDRKKVFIANGPVHSNQAENFDMTPMILELADRFPKTIFFVTEGMSDGRLNTLNANSLVGEKENLVELSYLSTFCDAIIGRNSGPQVLAWTKENCFSNKVNITFSKHKDCQHFVYDSPITMEKNWCNASDTFTTKAFVESVLFEKGFI